MEASVQPDNRFGLCLCQGRYGDDGTIAGAHVNGLQSLFAEFKANGLQKELSDFEVEEHGGAAWRVFYVVAPDGLCYWFGERQQDVSDDAA